MPWSSATFLPPLQSAQVLGATAQAATAFFTFPGRGRIWSAHIGFTLASNTQFNVSTFRAYARVLTGSGIVFCGPVELSVANPNQHESDHATLKIDGMLVGANDTLMLDVNNGVPVPAGGGIMNASCVVLYSVP